MGIVLPPGLSLTSPASTAAAHGSINTHHGGGHNSIIASSQVMRTRSPHSKYRGPQGTLLYLPEMFLKRVCHYFTIGCARFYFSSIYLLFFLQKRISEYNILLFVFASIFQMLFSFFFPCLWKGVGKTQFLLTFFSYKIYFNIWSFMMTFQSFRLPSTFNMLHFKKIVANCQKLRRKKLMTQSSSTRPWYHLHLILYSYCENCYGRRIICNIKANDSYKGVLFPPFHC